MKNATILVVDDEDIVCQSCALLLSEQGHEISTTQDPQQGLLMARERPFDLILVDLKMPNLDGMSFLRTIKDLQADTEVIVMTGFAEITSAVEAIKLGAFDYIPKPFNPDQLVIATEKALKSREMRAENRYLRRELQSRYKFETIVGSSGAMRSVYDLIEHVSTSNVTVLIRGESGTGKELVARAIHFNGPRKNRRFVAVDCGALHENLLESELFGHTKGAFTGATSTKKGLFEVADGGSLFLDEIGHTSLALQAKLLRVLQERVYTPVGDTRERKTDVRLIAATNRDLDAMVADESFRQELFYRLSIVPITLPPLRQRKEDIPALAAHFLKRFCEESGRDVPAISPEALHLLLDHQWPGNVRELENVMHRISVLSAASIITPADLPLEIGNPSSAVTACVPRTSQELKERKKEVREKSVEEVERSFVLAALQRSDWNISQAALDVHMQRSNFQALMRRYHIAKPPHR
ncbi:MAG: sigma-54-dependent transcriptional regulator [Pirellulaceae bacterium]